MPRTNGCSCSAAQIGSATCRSSSVKAIGERVPVEELVGLQQAGRSAGARRLAGRDEHEGLLLESCRRRGEEVEEGDRVGAVARAERVAHARAATSPTLQVRKEGE